MSNPAEEMTDEQATAEVMMLLDNLGRNAAGRVVGRMVVYGYDPDDLHELVEDECEVFRHSLDRADPNDARIAEWHFRRSLYSEGKVLSHLLDTAGSA